LSHSSSRRSPADTRAWHAPGAALPTAARLGTRAARHARMGEATGVAGRGCGRGERYMAEEPALPAVLAQGTVFCDQGEYDAALPLFERAAQLAPDSFEAWVNFGQTLGLLARHEEALLALDRALHLDPTSAVAWTAKGAALDSLGRYQEEWDAYDHALALD